MCHLLRICFFLLVCSTLACSAFAEKAIPSWQQRYFDGTLFREGIGDGAPAINLRDGFLPDVTAAGGAVREERLPAGTGGIVIFCYLQRIGGKIQNSSGSLPLDGAAVELGRKGWRMAARTDSQGYLVLALPPGEYTVAVLGQQRKIRIVQGKSALLAVRAGKRMVD